MSVEGHRQPCGLRGLLVLIARQAAFVTVARSSLVVASTGLGGTGVEARTARHGVPIPPLARFHDVLVTTSRREFGSGQESFRLAVEWQHQRLLEAVAAAAAKASTDNFARGKPNKRTEYDGISASSDVEDIADGLARTFRTGDNRSGVSGSGKDQGWGTYVFFTSHNRARAARSALADNFSPASVATLAHNQRHGGCFLVHASASAVNALALRDETTRQYGSHGGKTRMEETKDDVFMATSASGDLEEGPLFEGFVALPPNLKISPSLFDHYGVSRAPAPAVIETESTSSDGTEVDHSDDTLDNSTANRDTDHGNNNGKTRISSRGGGRSVEETGEESRATFAGGRETERVDPHEANRHVAGDLQTTVPGKAVHEGGLIVFLSPGSVPVGEEKAVAERWRRGWASPTLDLYGLSFWSDPQGARAGAGEGVPGKPAARGPNIKVEGARTTVRTTAGGSEDVIFTPHSELETGVLLDGDGRSGREEKKAEVTSPIKDRDGTVVGVSSVVGESSAEDGRVSTAKTEAETEAATAAALVREWVGAARVVHALAERRGLTPGDACGWDRVRVAPEGPGLMTVRGIGHLLVGDSASPNNTKQAPHSGTTPLSERERTSCLMGLVSFLASRTEAARVSPLPRAELFNAVASRVVQSASETRTPLWDRGVDGSGQVIQIVDSGIQEGSCYFADSADGGGVRHGYLLDEDGNPGTGDFTYDLAQRKVIQYIEGTKGGEAYTSDDSGGHGSHVAGSAAGAVYGGWEGPAGCAVNASSSSSDGGGGSSEEETVLSCVGKCMNSSALAALSNDATFSLDAWCPEHDCDTYWPQYCMTDNRTATLKDASGVAPGAAIAVLDLGGSEGLQQVLGGDMWEASSGAGARLHSGSWGFSDEPCVVDDASVSFDAWAYENPDHLLIFAAGNLGDDMTGCSIASPAIGKNCLAVGSSMSGLSRLSQGDMDVVSDFSSIGPTPDERIKPDVLAPGHFVFSASNEGDGSCALEVNSGTSMSCPIAAGAAAIVRQYFADGFYAADAEARGLCGTAASTAAAMLIHGAHSMGGTTDPDGERGFGRIHLESSLPFEGEDVSALYVEDTKSSSPESADGGGGGGGGTGSVAALSVEERVFEVTAADAALAGELADGEGGGLRVTLVWMDPPATAFSATQLEHDLDLFLEGPDGTIRTMLGVCSSDQNSCSVDSANNVERIVVSSSDVTAGTWTVKISAENDLVEGGPQDFALVVSLPLSAGSWTGSGGTSSTSSSTAHSTPAPAADRGSPTVPPVGDTRAPVDTSETLSPIASGSTAGPVATDTPLSSTDSPVFTGGPSVPQGPPATDAPVKLASATASPAAPGRTTPAPSGVTNKPVAPAVGVDTGTPFPSSGVGGGGLSERTPSPGAQSGNGAEVTSGGVAHVGVTDAVLNCLSWVATISSAVVAAVGGDVSCCF